ncbi:MAG: sigma-70 family RNA polymerase sigma factor [Pseudomonadota bacterium]
MSIHVETANAPEAGRNLTGADADLLEALRRGDPATRAAAWARLGRLAHRVVGRFFGPGLDPADLVQEVYLRLLPRLDEMKEPEDLRRFVIGTALGVARNQARRARFRRVVGFTVSGDLPEVAVGAADMEAREAVRRFYSVLDDARAEDRSLFVARLLEKMDMNEIAATHGLSFGTAKRRVARALERIGRRIESDHLLAEYLHRDGGWA